MDQSARLRALRSRLFLLAALFGRDVEVFSSCDLERRDEVARSLDGEASREAAEVCRVGAFGDCRDPLRRFEDRAD
jgi:hypothetical protein